MQTSAGGGPDSVIDFFRDAWLSLEGATGYLADLERRSLRAVAQEVPQLQAALADLENPERLDEQR